MVMANALAGPVMELSIGASRMTTGVVVVVGVGGRELSFAQMTRNRPLRPGSTLRTGQAMERPLFATVDGRQDVERRREIVTDRLLQAWVLVVGRRVP